MRRAALFSIGLLGSLGFCLSTSAQPRVPADMEVPWTDVAPARHGDVLSAAAVGTPDERVGRYDARRASARTRGRQRAITAIHRWVDDALARVLAPPLEAAAVHAAIDRGARVARVRPLVDASAVVVVEVPVAALRGACAREGLPWTA